MRRVLLLLAIAALSEACGGGGKSTAAHLPAQTPSPDSAPVAAAGAAPHTCRQDQLAVDYRGGGYATQSVFGSIVVRNRSSHDCRVTGRIVVLPRSADDALIRLVEPLTWKATPTTLTADATRWPTGSGERPGAHVLILQLMGWEVDQSSGGSAPCRPVTPASWRVEIATSGSLTVPNADPDLTGQRGFARSLFGCRGHILAEGFLLNAG